VNSPASTLSAVSFTVVARLFTLATAFASSILTARGLGVEGRGQYYAVMTLAGIIAQFGNLGLSSSNTFLAAKDRTHLWPLLVNSLWVAIAIGVVTAAVVALLGERVTDRLGIPPGVAWTLCISAPAILAFTLFSSLLVANERFFAMNMWSMVNAVLVLLGVAASMIAGAQSGTFVVVTMTAALIAAACLGIDVGRSLPREGGWGFDQGRLRASLQFASRAYLALLAGFLIQRIGVALLVFYRGPADIGVFSIAVQIADVMVILPTSMAIVLFPTLVRDPGDAWRKTRQALLITLALMSLLSAGVWLLGEPVLEVVFGAAFVPSYPVLLWLLPAVLAISVTSVLSQYVVAEGFPRSLVALWIAGLIASAGVGALLVDRFGAIGAAKCQSAGAVLVCAGVIALTLRRRRQSLKSELRV
jgi:O-antigen/teichoic acid export membrane protein